MNTKRPEEQAPPDPAKWFYFCGSWERRDGPLIDWYKEFLSHNLVRSEENLDTSDKGG